MVTEKTNFVILGEGTGVKGGQEKANAENEKKTEKRRGIEREGEGRGKGIKKKQRWEIGVKAFKKGNPSVISK